MNNGDVVPLVKICGLTNLADAQVAVDAGADYLGFIFVPRSPRQVTTGQVQAIGTAADASVVMLELKQSLDVMTESMNQTTQFVSETQAFFRANLDNLLEELELYDDETRQVLDKNLEMSRQIEDQRIQEAVAIALERKREGDSGAAPAAG